MLNAGMLECWKSTLRNVCASRLYHSRIPAFQHLALVLVVSCTCLTAADTPPVNDGWRFSPNQILVYTYETTQDVSWSSAGDKLSYLTTIAWRFTLVPKTITAERVELSATILSLKASHTGPGTPQKLDSADNTGEDSPLLGHLLTLVNATFVITCDPRSGQVASVSGGAEVAARIAAKTPSSFGPGEASPLAEPAKQAYDSAHLAPLWSRLLTVPTTGTRTVSLGPPLGTALNETWKDNAWTWALPAGAVATAVTIATDPTPITATLTELKGGGTVAPGAVPQETRGQLDYTLRFNALTQPVDQQHRLRWRLKREGGN